MQAVITDDKKSNAVINANEMWDIIKEAIKNKKVILYRGSFQSIEKNSNTFIQRIKLSKNKLIFQYITLEDDEVTRKIEEIIASSKESKKSSPFKAWYVSDQEKDDKFVDLWLLISKKIKSYIYFQILIQDNLYIIHYSTFKKLYKMMNEKSINYIFNFQTSKIESCNPPLNFNSQNALDTSFYIPFDLLIEEEVRDKKLEYILTGYCYVRCSNNEVIEINEADFISIYK